MGDRCEIWRHPQYTYGVLRKGTKPDACNFSRGEDENGDRNETDEHNETDDMRPTIRMRPTILALSTLALFGAMMSIAGLNAPLIAPAAEAQEPPSIVGSSP